MKKLLLMYFVLITGFAHGQTQQVSLNGYSIADFHIMVNRFNTGNAIKPMQTCVWFSKTMVENMLKLLHSEKGPNNELIDGIRIYYATNTNGQNTVILVSTYTSGKNASVPSGNTHQDYFGHDISQDLFANSGNISGDICTDNSCGNGALLYQVCGSPCPDDINCDPQNSHYLTRQYAQNMVFNFSSNIINTQSEWFDLSMFDAMDNGSNYDGIRLYFSKHLGTDPISPSRDAFVVVSTKAGTIANTHIDNFNCNQTQAFFSTHDYLNFHLNNYIKKHPLMSKNKSKLTKIKALIMDDGNDNGELCPTNCYGITPP